MGRKESNQTNKHSALEVDNQPQVVSPTAIIINAKIWNTNLLLAFFSKYESWFKISYSVIRKLFEQSTTTALTSDLLGVWAFLGFLKSGGGGG